MEQKQLFQLALGLASPWQIKSIEFSLEKKRLDLYIDFEPGSKFHLGGDSPDTQFYPVHDTTEKEWRHLNFFQHECYLHARVPRVTLNDNSVQLVTPPWSGRSFGFTLLLEAFLMPLLQHMAVRQVETLTGISDDKLWRMLASYVNQAHEQLDMTSVNIVGVDETSYGKGHNKFISLFVDPTIPRSLFVTEGKDASTFMAFKEVLESHGGSTKKITGVTMDMSPAFISGAAKCMPNAEVIFDPFHVVKLFNGMVDKVRRREQNEARANADDEKQALLSGSRWSILKNRENLTDEQAVKLASIEMRGRNLQVYRAMKMRESLQDVYSTLTERKFKIQLKALVGWMRRSRIKEAMKLAETVKNHWDGIIAWFKTKASNGILEGMNSLIKAASARARGFRTFGKIRIIVYLQTGKLEYGKLNPAMNAH
jgi:transposase